MNSVPRWGNLECLTILPWSVRETLRYLSYVERPGLSVDGKVQRLALKMDSCHFVMSFHDKDDGPRSFVKAILSVFGTQSSGDAPDIGKMIPKSVFNLLLTPDCVVIENDPVAAYIKG